MVLFVDLCLITGDNSFHDTLNIRAEFFSPCFFFQLRRIASKGAEKTHDLRMIFSGVLAGQTRKSIDPTETNWKHFTAQQSPHLSDSVRLTAPFVLSQLGVCAVSTCLCAVSTCLCAVSPWRCATILRQIAMGRPTVAAMTKPRLRIVVLPDSSPPSQSQNTIERVIPAPSTNTTPGCDPYPSQSGS